MTRSINGRILISWINPFFRVRDRDTIVNARGLRGLRDLSTRARRLPLRIHSRSKVKG